MQVECEPVDLRAPYNRTTGLRVLWGLSCWIFVCLAYDFVIILNKPKTVDRNTSKIKYMPGLT